MKRRPQRATGYHLRPNVHGNTNVTAVCQTWLAKEADILLTLVSNDTSLLKKNVRNETVPAISRSVPLRTRSISDAADLTSRRIVDATEIWSTIFWYILRVSIISYNRVGYRKPDVPEITIPKAVMHDHLGIHRKGGRVSNNMNNGNLLCCVSVD